MQNSFLNFPLPKDYAIHSIQEWLNCNVPKLFLLVASTPCRKWSKWLDSEEKPYPCVCPHRDSICIELELYYELQNVTKLYNQQEYFNMAINEFQLINKDNEDAVLAWINKHKPVGSKMFFDPIISLQTNSQNAKLLIELDCSEFNSVIEFQRIYHSLVTIY